MNNEELFTATAIASWKLVHSRLDTMFASFSDDELQHEIAPGKNRVFYLLGHLAAVNDRLLPMLYLGERLHPELDEEFLTNPDSKAPGAASAQQLRKAWAEVNAALLAAFEALPAQDWLLKHSAVSDEDFARDPLRNRFAVLLSRAGHAAFHAGQVRLVK